MQKNWKLEKYDENYINKISKKYNISEILAKLIAARGVEEDKIEEYLKPDLKNIKDPFLIKDMEKFVNRIKQAVENKEKVCIYGDYDVDGITSITIMYKFLKKLEIDVSYYLPDRLIEGYGVNNAALDEIKKRGCSLVITVDCGITAVDEVEYAKKIGLEICITDHHECADILPDAVCIINPKQKDDKSLFKYHAGVGVAFKCLMALAKEYGLENDSYLEYLDIVAVGTISDIVALEDENRVIAKLGLLKIKNTTNVGLRALIKVLGITDVDSIGVSFLIAPRINACGRMGKASVAVELFLEEDEKKAYELAMYLNELNKQRQEVEKTIFDSAIKMIESRNLDKKSSIVLYDRNWHSGVIGIVASRLVNIYYKPVILLTKENGTIRGSGRCMQGMSLYDCLTCCKEYLIQFGGHELAAGLSIEEEEIPNFYEKFDNVVKEKYKDDIKQEILIDCEIKLQDLNSNLIKDINKIKPYGQCNLQPLFLYNNLKVEAIRTLKDDKHLKMTLRDGKFLVEALAFSQGDRRDEVIIGDRIDIVCNVDINTYNTPKTIQFILNDFKKSV